MKKRKYHKLTIIGLVGAVACGKSSAAGAFERRGARVINADELTHIELDRPASRRKLQRAFGKAILTNDKVDRRKVSNIVFSGNAQLKVLTSIIHPPVIRAIHAKLRRANGRKHPAVVVLDAALLIEAGLVAICDHVIYIQCSHKSRLWRAKSSRKWPHAELARREKFQCTLKEKKAAASSVINNNLSPAYLDRAVEKFWIENISDIPVKLRTNIGSKNPPILSHP